uniref:Ubiquitin thioesterase OTU n=1 Tax=Timema tahoe TaxID=61484 RepID=A0A7R9NWH3_9NEOP|nr:unnamed protein product [Timema tahoe]
MAGFVLKVKTKSGQMVVTSLNSKSTIADLKTTLSSLTNIKENCLHVLSGFPPKPLNLSPDEASLETCKITSGDTLIVEEKEPPIESVSFSSSLQEEARHHIITDQFASPGILMKKVVPADNSCLFTSLGFVLGGTYPLIKKIERPTKSCYIGDCKAILLYVRLPYNTILYYWSVWIALFLFGWKQKLCQGRCARGVGGSIQTIFLASDQRVLNEAYDIAKEAKSSRQFTDVDKFTLRCMVCSVFLTGQIQAQQHAKESGHMNFGEIK